jgi:hypothetical protein
VRTANSEYPSWENYLLPKYRFWYQGEEQHVGERARRPGPRPWQTVGPIKAGELVHTEIQRTPAYKMHIQHSCLSGKSHTGNVALNIATLFWALVIVEMMFFSDSRPRPKADGGFFAMARTAPSVYINLIKFSLFI